MLRRHDKRTSQTDNAQTFRFGDDAALGFVDEQPIRFLFLRKRDRFRFAFVQ